MRSAERALWTATLAAWLAGCSSLPGLSSTTPDPTPQGEPKPADTTQASAGVAKAGATPKPAAGDAASVPAISPAVQRAFDTARQALAAGRTAEAERGFTALTKSNPELAGPYANLGLIYRQAGRNADAIAALEKAVQLAPGRADLHNQLGIAYRGAGAFDKAKGSYERSISLDPNYAPAILNLGILYDLYLWDGAHALELYDR